MTPSLPDSDAPPASPIERLEALFWAAVNMPPDEREAFLSVQCPDDPDLRSELRRMLAADERAGAFLEIPLPEVLASDLPRASVARWKLLECVGEGGLGVVYRAECIEDGVKLEAAVKILRPGLDTGKFREKFVKERQILAGLDHPGIVRLMDCGADSRWPFLPGHGVYSGRAAEHVPGAGESLHPAAARAFRIRLRGR